MTDGQTACCVLGVCCPPAQQRMALTTQIGLWRSEVKPTGDLDAYLADMILSTWDLVPLGVGQAIVAGYRAVFEEACAELPPYAGPIDPETPIQLT